MRLWRIQIPLGRHSRLKPVKDRQALLFLGPVENPAQRGPSRLTSETTYRGWGLGFILSYEDNPFWISRCMDSTTAMGSLAVRIGRPTTT
jgi:hypothetical protein